MRVVPVNHVLCSTKSGLVEKAGDTADPNLIFSLDVLIGFLHFLNTVKQR